MLSLDALCQELHRHLSSTELPLADDKYVKSLLEDYDHASGDWERFAHFDECKPYTRNLVTMGDRFDLILLCWNPAKFSPIHDHAGANCWFKVCQGDMVEEQFRDRTSESLPPESIARHEFSEGGVAYINDTMALHKVGSMHGRPAVSLHLYSPPNRVCHTFSEDAYGRKACPCSFYSKGGEVLHYEGDA